MADSNDAPGAYVKLQRIAEAEANAPPQETLPGELVQAIPDAINPELNSVRKCHECGQLLPETYEPPRNEPWLTGIFDCMSDRENCAQAAFCPCVVFGKNVETLKDIPWQQTCWCHAIFVEGSLALAAATIVFSGTAPGAGEMTVLITEALLFSWWMCAIHTGLFRQELERKYHLKSTPCNATCVHCMCHWCALCQEHREMKCRISLDDMVPMTVVNPPVQQEMAMASLQAETQRENGSL